MHIYISFLLQASEQRELLVVAVTGASIKTPPMHASRKRKKKNMQQHPVPFISFITVTRKDSKTCSLKLKRKMHKT